MGCEVNSAQYLSVGVSCFGQSVKSDEITQWFILTLIVARLKDLKPLMWDLNRRLPPTVPPARPHCHTSHVNQSHRLSLVTLKKSGFYMPSTLNTAESLHRFRVEMSKAKCTTQESSAVDQKGIFLVTITQDNNGAVTSDSRCWAADMAPLFQPWQLKRCTKIHNGCILKGHSL